MEILAASSPVKSVQRGVLVLSTLATYNIAVSSVDMSKSFLTSSIMNQTTSETSEPYAALTTATNINFKRGNSGVNCRISWELIEYV